MQLKDLEVADNAEAWVTTAFSKAVVIGHGSFSVVLEAAEADLVVKLTLSTDDYQALVHFSGSSPHFARVIRHAPAQATGPDGSYNAVLMEKLPDTYPAVATAIANHINVQPPHKHHPLGLLAAASHLQRGDFPQYPGTLAPAICALAEYATERMLKVELNQRANWGLRSDGTLVMFDLVHSRREM